MRGVAMAKNAAIIAWMAAVPSAAQSARAQRVPDYDFDWATIGDPGNIAYPGDRFGQNESRGSVPYSYRMATVEVTTAQWMEFVNTYSTQSDDLADFGRPFWWGAVIDDGYEGPGRKWMLDSSLVDAARLPVTNITWREAAMYCNWLHNSKDSGLWAIEDGAYDTSTFSDLEGGRFGDQATHHPDALFWIPTLDEWLKAAHYDPNRNGAGEPGWWLYSHQSEERPIPGPPGKGQTSADYLVGTLDALLIPLGAYPDTLSPWGLLDITGGTHEWTEEIRGDREFRISEGNAAGSDFVLLDEAGFGYWEDIASPSLRTGLRIASIVPCPAMGSFGAIALVTAITRPRRFRTCPAIEF